LALRDINGEAHDLRDYRGKLVLLNFWATWCPPCVEEIPSLGRLQKAFSKDDLVVLSVDIGESKKEVQAFLQQVPADFPVLLDPDGSTVEQWKVIAFPTTFVIGRDGIIKLAYFGGLEWDNPSVVSQIQELANN
jgi:thiol-disulfide isomerase/thioredoxin